MTIDQYIYMSDSRVLVTKNTTTIMITTKPNHGHRLLVRSKLYIFLYEIRPITDDRIEEITTQVIQVHENNTGLTHQVSE